MKAGFVWLMGTILILLLPITFDSILCAQDFLLSGSVKDGDTGLPLDSALVEVICPINERRDGAYTDQNGDWRISLNPSDCEEAAKAPPQAYVLPNSPNPFHSPTQLRFFTAQAGRVEIAVYNLRGQQLDTKSWEVTAGEYTVEWAGQGSAGILFYSITINGERVGGKMIQLTNGNAGLGNIIRRQQSPPTSFLPKRAQQEYTLIASKLAYEPDTLVQTISGDTRIDFALETVHRRARVIDLHNDILERVVEKNYQLGLRHTTNHSDIPRFRDGGLDAQLFSIWVDPNAYRNNPYQQALKFFEAINKQIALNPNDLAHVRNVAELEQAQAESKIAGILAVEGGHAIENSLEKLNDFYERGARCMTITWNNSTDWAISARDSRSATFGLSDFGRQVIQRMDSLGMIIDVSRTGIKTIEDILALTRNPIIASHSGARALRNHTRNLSDDQIRQIARSGGVIGVMFDPSLLTSTGQAGLNDVISHIDYIVNLAGVDYVAIGSDFDGISAAPAGLEDVSKLPQLTAALLARGYSRAEARKILGENFLRVFRQVCK
jgi:membrane dipeptidase